MTKPPLFVVAFFCDPHDGGENAKGYQTALALSHRFSIHLFTSDAPERIAAWQRGGPAESWEIETIPFPFPLARHPFAFYPLYARWCGRLLKRAEAKRRSLPEAPVGLHHVTLGSFRALPRYDRLGLPYTLGTLGGGEAVPPSLLKEIHLPPLQRAIERGRPLINRACAFRPAVHRVLAGASTVLTTTEETARLLRAAGARKTEPLFPDVFNPREERETVAARRRAQASEGLSPLRMVWACRFRWWKGGQIAAAFLTSLKRAGIEATLDIFSDGNDFETFRRHVASLGCGDAVRFHGAVPNAELLDAFRRSHLFVYPSLHDSSSAILPEASALGLPTMTLGLGGTGTATAPGMGLNSCPGTLAAWMEEGTAMVRRWQADPERWLAASLAALDNGARFSSDHLREAFEKALLPVFLPKTKNPRKPLISG